MRLRDTLVIVVKNFDVLSETNEVVNKVGVVNREEERSLKVLVEVGNFLLVLVKHQYVERQGLQYRHPLLLFLHVVNRCLVNLDH